MLWVCFMFCACWGVLPLCVSAVAPCVYEQDVTAVIAWLLTAHAEQMRCWHCQPVKVSWCSQAPVPKSPRPMIGPFEDCSDQFTKERMACN